MNIYFGRHEQVKSVADAVELYSRAEFQSPTRSTVPLISLLTHAPAVFEQVVAELGMPSSFDLYLEFTVRSPKGSGKASHSDMMLKTDHSALAVEAKWTEPIYESVSKWLTRGTNPGNRKLVLDGWIDLLQEKTEKTLVPEEFKGCVYQMLHRAASAAVSEQPKLAYFHFKPSPHASAATSDDIMLSLRNLWATLGQPKSFPFYLVEIELSELDAYKALKKVSPNEDTAELVIDALQGTSPLFGFAKPKVTNIGA